MRRVDNGQWQILSPSTVLVGDHLSRHGLQQVLYPSRARVVDAVRMALSVEPRQSEHARTVWKRVRPGEYHSRDGAWTLLREGTEIRLIPRSPAAKEAVEGDPYPEALLRMDGPRTLKDCALLTDQINLRLGL